MLYYLAFLKLQILLVASPGKISDLEAKKKEAANWFPLNIWLMRLKTIIIVTRVDFDTLELVTKCWTCYS